MLSNKEGTNDTVIKPTMRLEIELKVSLKCNFELTFIKNEGTNVLSVRDLMREKFPPRKEIEKSKVQEASKTDQIKSTLTSETETKEEDVQNISEKGKLFPRYFRGTSKDNFSGQIRFGRKQQR